MTRNRRVRALAIATAEAALTASGEMVLVTREEMLRQTASEPLYLTHQLRPRQKRGGNGKGRKWWNSPR